MRPNIGRPKNILPIGVDQVLFLIQPIAMKLADQVAPYVQLSREACSNIRILEFGLQTSFDSRCECQNGTPVSPAPWQTPSTQQSGRLPPSTKPAVKSLSIRHRGGFTQYFAKSPRALVGRGPRNSIVVLGMRAISSGVISYQSLLAPGLLCLDPYFSVIGADIQAKALCKFFPERFEFRHLRVRKSRRIIVVPCLADRV